MNAIAATGLRKRYGDAVAVADVNLVLAEGEVRGLLGPNGAGKTTLLRMLLGLIAPDEGTIELFGDAGRVGSGAVGNYGVAGFVEMPCFYPYLTGRENLEVLAEFDGNRHAAGVDAALERVGLETRARDRVSGYSTGMRQRLGIAAALISAPTVLLLDEPTSGLDPAGAREIAGLIRSLAAGGTSILLSSHQIGEVEDICHTFTVLTHGRVVWDGTGQRLRAQAPASAFSLQTTDDHLAVEISEAHPGIEVVGLGDSGLRLSATQEAVDVFTLDLARADVAVRRLDLLLSPLESMFFSLTDQEPPHPRGPAASAVGGR